MKEKKKIEAVVVTDSISVTGTRITTWVLTYPRIIHSELMTHRVFSRNSASSRAIPFKKMVQSVKEDPFIPIAWQKEHTGMQGTEYYTNPDSIKQLRELWVEGAGCAIEIATALNSKSVIDLDCPEKDGGVTKQLCNRLLEPFLWHTVLVTTTEYGNFFDLRCPEYRTIVNGEEVLFSSKKELIKFQPHLAELSPLEWLQKSESGAEIHIQALAEAMWDSLKENTPSILEHGEWHIPFGDLMDRDALHDYGIVEMDNNYDIDELILAVATARCARVSYMTFDGKIDYAKDIELYRQLLASGHLSPFEHCAQCMSDFELDEANEEEIEASGVTHFDFDGFLWSGNFREWAQLRQLIK